MKISVFTAEGASKMPEIQESWRAGVSGVAVTKEVMLGKLRGVKVDKSHRPDEQHARV